MRREPDFDELVGEVGAADAERLRRVHDMLVEAGPPPELTPALQQPGEPPTADIAFFPKRRHAAAAVAAAALAAAAFGGGYLLGHSGDGEARAREVVKLRATDAAPRGALASLRLGERDEDGNWTMDVKVSGLRELPPRGYYNVYLWRGGEPRILCGSFTVAGDPSETTDVRFTVPYRVRPGDRWVVTEQQPGVHDPGPVLLTT